MLHLNFLGEDIVCAHVKAWEVCWWQ